MIDIFQKFRKMLIDQATADVLKNIQPSLEEIQYKSLSNRRFYAVSQIAEYLFGAIVPGDYCEFGVWQGTTFIHAYQWMAPLFKKMRFLAFDSFEGLPEPKGIDLKDGFSSNFHQKDFLCSKKDFLKNLEKAQVNLKKVSIVEGWFSQTLKKNEMEYRLKKIAVAWIDCDLYESTVPVLDFIKPLLRYGSVIVFDDWRCFKNNPKLGPQRACLEWLKKNPKIKLNELFTFGWHGMVFTVLNC